MKIPIPETAKTKLPTGKDAVRTTIQYVPSLAHLNRKERIPKLLEIFTNELSSLENAVFWDPDSLSPSGQILSVDIITEQFEKIVEDLKLHEFRTYILKEVQVTGPEPKHKFKQDAHTSHCCAAKTHPTCKYRQETECTVLLGIAPQETFCEDCFFAEEDSKPLQQLMDKYITAAQEEKPTKMNGGECGGGVIFFNTVKLDLLIKLQQEMKDKGFLWEAPPLQ